MNTKKGIVLFGLILVLITFSSFKSAIDLKEDYNMVLNQDNLIVYATYDGHEDYGYNFITTDKDGEERTLTFQKVEDAVLKSFDLNSVNVVGTKFKVTFNKVIKVTKDADNMEDEEEINTITMLETL